MNQSRVYKKSRIKIILLIVIVAAAIWAATLAVIYFTTYKTSMDSCRNMLNVYSELYLEKGMPEQSNVQQSRYEASTFYSVAIDGDKIEVVSDNAVVRASEVGPPDSALGADSKNAGSSEPGNNAKAEMDETGNSDGESSASENAGASEGGSDERPSASNYIYDDDQLINLAREILASNSDFGIKNNVIYLVSQKESLTLVAMMDNTDTLATLDLLIHYSVIIGIIAVVVIAALSILFAHMIVKPLEKNDARQKTFVSNAGHDLKTPIAAISANAELLEREIGENQWLKNIRYENNKMEVIIKGLLAMARPEGGTPDFENVNLSHIVTAELLAYEARSFESGHNLKQEIEKDVYISGNESKLSMLMDILLDNAFSYADACGEISVSLNAAHSSAILTIKNPASEMTEAELEKIFDRFYRSDSSREGNNNHYGLGLAILQSIVSEHKGNISALCRKGFIEFKITIPVVPSDV